VEADDFIVFTGDINELSEAIDDRSSPQLFSVVEATEKAELLDLWGLVGGEKDLFCRDLMCLARRDCAEE
jgi:hypothetical protein